jgi:hypothetical protein
MNNRCVEIKIDRSDIVLLEVALDERMKTWKRTKEYWQKVEEQGDFEGVYVKGEIEEANSLYEAEKMVKIWEGFIRNVMKQF